MQQGNWLTEKPFGVIISVVPGFVAPGTDRRPPVWRRMIGIVALAALVAIARIATTEMPLLGFV